VEASVAAENDRSRGRRVLEVTVLVAVVIGIGLVFDMSVEAYVALSFPAAVVFQLYVRRRALHEMWVRRGPAVSRRSVMPWLAGVFALPPLIALVTGYLSDAPSAIVWGLVVALGCVPASYVIKQRSPDTLRCVILCLATAGLIGVALLSLNGIAGVVEELSSAEHSFFEGAEREALTFVLNYAILWPGYYVVEEVLFRGVVDSHVHHEGERHGLVSAIFVSLLWGSWHLPVILAVTPDAPAGEVIASMYVLQGLVGPFLSHWWRRSGNLLVPAVTHDFLDSFRNATQGLS
jgi:membrane protease YdiL (CAAX protease family)